MALCGIAYCYAGFANPEAHCTPVVLAFSNGALVTNDPLVFRDFSLAVRASMWADHQRAILRDGHIYGNGALYPILGNITIVSNRSPTTITPSELLTLESSPSGLVEIRSPDANDRDPYIGTMIEVERHFRRLSADGRWAPYDPTRRFITASALDRLREADLNEFVGRLMTGLVDDEPNLYIVTGQIQRLFVTHEVRGRTTETLIYAEILTSAGQIQTIPFTNTVVGSPYLLAQ